MIDLKFTSEDVEANRLGILTDRQRRALQHSVKEMWKTLKYISFLVGVVCVGLALIAVFILKPALFDQESGAAVLIILLIPPALIGGLLIVFIIWAWMIARSIKHEQLKRIDGRAKVEISAYRGTHHYGVTLYNRYSRIFFSFESEASLKHFKSGKRYRVYYVVSHPPKAVSVEELPDQKKRRSS